MARRNEWIRAQWDWQALPGYYGCALALDMATQRIKSANARYHSALRVDQSEGFTQKAQRAGEEEMKQRIRMAIIESAWWIAVTIGIQFVGSSCLHYANQPYAHRENVCGY